MRTRIMLATASVILVSVLWTWTVGPRLARVSGPIQQGADPIISQLSRALGPKPLYAREPESHGAKKARQDAARVLGGDMTPERAVCDPYPEFNGVALDPAANLVVFTAPNLKRLMLYDRRAGSNTPDITTALGMIGGEATRIAGESGVTLDPVRQEIYSVDTDIGNTLSVFSYRDRGAAEARKLALPVGSYGISLSQHRQQVAVTNEDNGVLMIFSLRAKEVESPLREIRGAKTGLAEPKGVFWDDVNHEIVVENDGDINHGKWDPDYTGGGRYNPPSITVYADDAKDNAAPLRTIQGAKTQLDTPVGLAVDLTHNEIFVANIGSDSVTVYNRDANGDVAPIRVLKGPQTGIHNIIGVAVDPVNDELWVANFGHAAQVFERTAQGDSAPKRILRNAPQGSATVGVILPQALAFDSKRDRLLVGH